jgi:hypothetical protein
MHDPEKSDDAIVAEKPLNNAGRPDAEAVEPRASTKGTAEQQSTRRTQSRARVTQALDRVRQAARLRKKEQFTTLLHHINVDTLRTVARQSGLEKPSIKIGKSSRGKGMIDAPRHERKGFV